MAEIPDLTNDLIVIMKTETIYTEIEIFGSKEDLPPDELQLLEDAIVAKSKAYAPYSRFKVGAAVLLQTGTVVCGNNQENAAYPSGLCAERVAVYSAGAQFPGIAIHKLAITASTEAYAIKKPVAPCGACRQAILEYEMNQATGITVLMYGECGEVYRVKNLKNLLPLYFGQSDLNGKEN